MFAWKALFICYDVICVGYDTIWRRNLWLYRSWSEPPGKEALKKRHVLVYFFLRVFPQIGHFFELAKYYIQPAIKKGTCIGAATKYGTSRTKQPFSPSISNHWNYLNTFGGQRRHFFLSPLAPFKCLSLFRGFHHQILTASALCWCDSPGTSNSMQTHF